ncbi:hypothetical protein B8V81_2730 [Paenibacillus pasadenensis]|uniref:Uncharacterized protein n=1 Tax=Paenibacillus pasadenensis TaxID=217090 RepID=A0A2N5N1U0_9BACL|nr:hypothetical protein B8V81_2730 [Paenibacillus pasadenensis]
MYVKRGRKDPESFRQHASKASVLTDEPALFSRLAAVSGGAQEPRHSPPERKKAPPLRIEAGHNPRYHSNSCLNAGMIFFDGHHHLSL